MRIRYIRLVGMRYTNAQPRVSHIAAEEQSLGQFWSSRVTVTAESVFTTHLRRVGEYYIVATPIPIILSTIYPTVGPSTHAEGFAL